MGTSQKWKVWATWTVEAIPQELDELHISCGQDDDDQATGYFPHDKGTELHIVPVGGAKRLWRITLIAPALGLNRYAQAWLSPNQLEHEIGEADFGFSRDCNIKR